MVKRTVVDIGFVEQNVDVEAERLFRRVATDVTGNRCLTSSSLHAASLNFDTGQVETRDRAKRNSWQCGRVFD